MGKKRVNITVDPDVYAEAKEMGLNVSGVAERALRSYIQALKDETQQSTAPVLVGVSDQRKQLEKPVSNAGGADQDVEYTVDEILEEYEAYATNVLNRSERTLNQHRRYVGRLLRGAQKAPSEIDEADIITYLESEQPMSDSKRQNVLSALRVFFREFVGTEVADDFELPTTTPQPTKVPTKEELQTFYDVISNSKYRAIFLMYATSGLRSAELLGLTMDDIDEGSRMLIPDKQSEVKKTWVSFYNEEAAKAFEAFKPEREQGDDRAFQASKPTVNTTFRRLSEKSGVKITPQMLRRWFASEMSSLGVGSNYVDAFCGRTPDSVLEKHYLDYSPRKLKQIYDEAGLTVLR